MTSEIDELSINFEEDDILVCKELDKEILTKGAWTTILFRYQNWNKKEQAYGSDCYTIRRYQKSQGRYMQRSKFNISNKKQAKKIITILEDWVKDE